VELTKKYLKWFVISDSAKAGGVASAIMEIFMDADCNIPKIVSFEYDDNFIKHGATAKVEEYLGILPEQIAMRIKESLDI
jgi:1-deoxy-D-xylulose-5-phosphate synthase